MTSFALPDLPPAIKFRLMRQTEEELALSFEVKRAAMGPHVTIRWGWDEQLQYDMHRAHFSAKPFFEISRAGDFIGTVSFQILSDHIRFGEFYQLPNSQRNGTGTAILRHCLGLADSLKLPVRLEYLQWNPVGSLYRRHGFEETNRSEIHIFMERPVAQP
jgi:GNAT superfamily N-acetyltransferase